MAAVSEYLHSHPEILSSGHNLQIIIRPNITRERLEEIVRAMLAERLPSADTRMESPPDGEMTDPSLTAVAEMLGNLDFFV